MNERDIRSGEWPGVIDTAALKPEVVAASNRLADAAKAGAWDTVFDLLEASFWLGPNHWRVAGSSWCTPLHQAAWHGAPIEVADRLIALGAWRSLRDSSGQRPVDIARARGHRHLLESLSTPDLGPREREKHEAWDRHLDQLVRERTKTLDPVRYRPISTEVVESEQLDPLWFPFPGMYGGFSVSVYRTRLFVESWCRVVGGSGQAHVITEDGCVLVDEGFV